MNLTVIEDERTRQLFEELLALPEEQRPAWYRALSEEDRARMRGTALEMQAAFEEFAAAVREMMRPVTERLMALAAALAKVLPPPGAGGENGRHEEG